MTTLGQSLSLVTLNSRARLIFTGLLIAAAAAAAIGLLDAFLLVVTGEHQVVDFRPYYTAAEAVLRGETLYPAVDDTTLGSGRAYVYPPLTAIVVIPLSLLPVSVAEGIVVLGGALAVIATLLAVGVRDWRCYVIAFCWMPVLSAVQLGNVTVFLGLAAALAWRFRYRDLPTSISIGATLAIKLFLWPLIIWLVATRRLRAALFASAFGAGLFAVSWAVVGFEGMVDYPDLLRRLQGEVELGSYAAYVVVLDAGAPSWVARAVWLALGLALLGSVLIVGRRGGDRTAFILAIVAALALTPIVWLHYFELLLVAVAVARPRLGFVWFVPLTMWFVSTTDSGNGTLFQTSATLVVAGVTVALALRASVEGVRPVGSDPERRLSPAPWWHERLGGFVRGQIRGI